MEWENKKKNPTTHIPTPIKQVPDFESDQTWSQRKAALLFWAHPSDFQHSSVVILSDKIPCNACTSL